MFYVLEWKYKHSETRGTNTFEDLITHKNDMEYNEKLEKKGSAFFFNQMFKKLSVLNVLSLSCLILYLMNIYNILLSLIKLRRTIGNFCIECLKYSYAILSTW